MRQDDVEARRGAGRRFANPPGSPTRGGTAGEWAAFSWRRFKDGARRQPGLPATQLLSPAEVRAGMAALGDADGLTWLGHSSFLIRLGGRLILTDPFLADYASPYAWLGPWRHTPPALRADELPPVDVVLVSHAHYDHLDVQSLAALRERQRATIVTGLEMHRYLRDLGFGAIVELGWHEAAALAGLEVTALPAIHFSRRGAFDLNQTLWCSFRIASGASTVYFAGDTGYGPVFAEIGARYSPPDLALVPIGAYAPKHMMEGAHCTPEEAVALGRDLRAPRLCAMHWGAIRLTDEPITEPPQRFRAAANAAGYAAEEALVLRIGETRRL